MGERLLECAAREAMEETGLDIVGDGRVGPVAFTAVDLIQKEKDGSVAYHYAIVEVASVLPKGSVARAGSDADDVAWRTYEDMLRMKDEITGHETHLQVAKSALDYVRLYEPQVFHC